MKGETVIVPAAIGLITPEEKWIGRPPSVNHLRVFRCAADAHESEGKLESKSLKGVVLGYTSGVKGFRIWLRDQICFKVIISRDVFFDGTKMPCKGRDRFSESDSYPLKDNGDKIQVELEKAEPKAYEKAINLLDRLKWVSAMREEMNSLLENSMCVFVVNSSL